MMTRRGLQISFAAGEPGKFARRGTGHRHIASVAHPEMDGEGVCVVDVEEKRWECWMLERCRDGVANIYHKQMSWKF